MEYNIKLNDKSKLPFVSICTPTFNRRPFIPYIIKMFLYQTYPIDKMEWIIIDDGTDKIEDLICDIPQVKYFKYDTKLSLGKKRNLMHDKSKGEIIVYMDDDDFYPPDRVSHAVDSLLLNPTALCAGSSIMNIFFKHINTMYQFGPYGKNHSTAATFAFRRSLLSITRYDETACVAEEKTFLKDYTIPFIQLDTTKTILVFSHLHNSFDKKILLKDIPHPFIKISDKSVDDYIKDSDIKKFFTEDIDELLKKYEPGELKYKPDVIKQIDEIQKKREDIINTQRQQQLNNMQSHINILTKENEDLKSLNKYLNEKIKQIIESKINEKKNNIKK